MSPLVPIALFGWFPLVVVSFLALPARRAVVAAYVTAWLFLPVASYQIPGFANYDKTSATNFSVMLGVVLFDTVRLERLRMRWFDSAALVFCLSPCVTSITNGLGLYDGLASSIAHCTHWGIPYVVGRMYFADLAGLEELALGIVIGGAVYVPLCLWEARMSPQLHSIVYGFHQHSFGQSVRGSTFRPTVFMQHGLAVGLWMSLTTLVGAGLWRSRSRGMLLGLPLYIVVPSLGITAVVCKSMGALVLLATGLAATWVVRRFSSALPVYLLLCLPVTYVAVRATDSWSGRSIVEFVEDFSPERAHSLNFRLESEDLLSAHARERAVFGWGGWGRNTVMRDAEMGLEAVTDGLWILVFGRQGAVGLASLLGMLLLPVFVFVSRIPPGAWPHPRTSIALALGVAVTLYMVDNLFNDMLNPVYVLVAGGLGVVRVSVQSRASEQRAANLTARAEDSPGMLAKIRSDERRGSPGIGAGTFHAREPEDNPGHAGA